MYVYKKLTIWRIHESGTADEHNEPSRRAGELAAWKK